MHQSAAMCRSHARSTSCPEGLSGTSEARSPRQQIRRTQARWSELIFAAKTTTAALIALLVAFTFNFDQPQWALLIVFIVAQPQSGLVLAKSFYRIIGVFIGAGVALLFVALFAQERVPFLGALGLWIGLCCFGFQYARNFTAYSFILSGYTAVSVGIPGALDAGTAVYIATARVTEMSLGIIVAATVSHLVPANSVAASLRHAIADARNGLADYAIALFSAGDAAPLRMKLLSQAIAIENLRAAAMLEDRNIRDRGRRPPASRRGVSPCHRRRATSRPATRGVRASRCVGRGGTLCRDSRSHRCDQGVACRRD